MQGMRVIPHTLEKKSAGGTAHWPPRNCPNVSHFSQLCVVAGSWCWHWTASLNVSVMSTNTENAIPCNPSPTEVPSLSSKKKCQLGRLKCKLLMVNNLAGIRVMCSDVYELQILVMTCRWRREVVQALKVLVWRDVLVIRVSAGTTQGEIAWREDKVDRQ